MRRRPSLAELRAAVWTWRAVRSARRQLRRIGYEGLVLPGVPGVSNSAFGGVNAILRRLPSTCLERAVVLQRWRAAHGDPHDVIVGVSGSSDRFRAHAWLDDEPPAPEHGRFQELVRLHP